MADSDILATRGHALEEEYFRRKDRELVERMRQDAEARADRAGLERATGLTDPSLVAELQALGFTPETVALLPLVPLIQVAWAEGGVTDAERDAIVRFARTRDVAPGSAADRQLDEWLGQAPAAGVFDGALRLIAAMLDLPGGTALGVTAPELARHCEAIALASGGIFGIIGRISIDERQLLHTIADRVAGNR